MTSEELAAIRARATCDDTLALLAEVDRLRASVDAGMTNPAFMEFMAEIAPKIVVARKDAAAKDAEIARLRAALEAAKIDLSLPPGPCRKREAVAAIDRALRGEA